jgi:hypothetical protein
MQNDLGGFTPCTVVSLFPRAINDQKPTVNFYINVPAAEPGDFSLQVITYSEASRYILDGESIGIPLRPAVLAESIVSDFCTNMVGYSNTTGPGIFWVEGAWSKAEIATKFKDRLVGAKARQNRYWGTLVSMADLNWQKVKDLRMISDLDRFAAVELGLNREWLQTPDSYNKVQECPACKSKVPVGAAVCLACRAVLDEAAAKKYKIAS